ncbi:hypothetical protein TRVL_09888 [Trypanosoma vivax]|nr:hypothetical protein TRVL_09888 [Trypanosoma vivax]
MSFHIPALNDDSLMQNLMALVTLLDSLASHVNKDVQQSVLAETNPQDVTEFRSMPWTVQSWRKRFRSRLRIAHLEEKEEVCLALRTWRILCDQPPGACCQQATSPFVRCGLFARFCGHGAVGRLREPNSRKSCARAVPSKGKTPWQAGLPEEVMFEKHRCLFRER